MSLHAQNKFIQNLCRLLDSMTTYTCTSERPKTVTNGNNPFLSSLAHRPSRKPRGKDPSYYSMSEDRAESDYGRTQEQPRYNNNYSDHQQPSRRPPYSNGPLPNHAPQGRDRYQRSKSSSDYLDYRDDPRRSRSTADQPDEEYYGSRRSAPSQAKKGHLREVNDGRMYNDAARV